MADSQIDSGKTKFTVTPFQVAVLFAKVTQILKTSKIFRIKDLHDTHIWKKTFLPQ